MTDIDWPMVISLGASALAAAVAAVDTLWKRRIQHDGLRLAAAKAKPLADSDPPPSGESASDPAPASAAARHSPGARRVERGARGSLPSVPEGVAWRAEVDARIADLRAEIDARLEHVRTEALREVGEAKTETSRLAERIDRVARSLDRLKATVLRGTKDLTDRLATLEGYLRGWIDGGGPGSRRR